MSTKACARKGCENTMCERHSVTHGYICNECLDELAEEALFVDIVEFMRTPRTESTYKAAEVWGEHVDEEFNLV